jgi:hypothetical protein
VYYNHEEEIFEVRQMKEGKLCTQQTELPHTKSLASLTNQKQSEDLCDGKNSLAALIPPQLMSKLHRISSQLDFITKTTQILEARVDNNG